MDAITAHQCHPSVIRASSEYLAWRESVLTRDHNICQLCGATEGLHVHHRVPISVNPSLATNIDNGITVCETCHHNIHRKKGYIKRTGRSDPKTRRIKEYQSTITKLQQEIKRLQIELEETEKRKEWFAKIATETEERMREYIDIQKRTKELNDQLNRILSIPQPKTINVIPLGPISQEMKPGLFKRLFNIH
jgi:DNA repair exonuclease SbcCD ATPase subunit